MRILLVAHGFPPTHSAGAERRAERMAHWFTKNGHTVEVIRVESATADFFRIEHGSQDGFPVHRLFYNIAADTDDPLLRTYNHPQVGEAIYDLLKYKTFDMMHIVSGYLIGSEAVRAAQRADVPTAITLTEFWFICPRLNLTHPTHKLCNGPDNHEKCARCLMEDKRRYRLPAKLAPKLMDAVWLILHDSEVSAPMRAAVVRRDETMRRTLEAADLVICPSQFLIEKFAEYGFKTEHFVYLRQGLAKPKKLLTQSSDGKQPDRLRLGYVGQIKEHKGVDVLVDAVIPLLKEDQPVSLDIWGEDTGNTGYGTWLQSCTTPFAEHIRWNGSYLGNAVWDVLAELDVLVVPSRWYENSPNAILEAFEMGIPVIATNLGGMSELVVHEICGLLFDLNSVEDLHFQINRLLHEPQLLKHLRANIPRVKSIDQELSELITLYNRLPAKTR